MSDQPVELYRVPGPYHINVAGLRFLVLGATLEWPDRDTIYGKQLTSPYPRALVLDIYYDPEPPAPEPTIPDSIVLGEN